MYNKIKITAISCLKFLSKKEEQMGLFGKTKELPFVSNGRLIEVINQNDAFLDEGIEEKRTYKALERQLERRFLYRNVESITPTGTYGIVIVKYKDLKVRSAMEVEQIKKQLRKEAGFDLER
jgi:hypothetical protein